MSDGKGQVSQEDVQKFAVDHGLPLAYVGPFFKGMSSISPDGPNSEQVPFSVFNAYVSARERALRRIFKKLDLDKDGKLSAEEMRAGLSHLLIQCPKSRCCYRATTGCISPSLISSCKSSVDFCTFRKFFLLLPQDKMICEYWLKANDPSACDVGAQLRYPDTSRKTNSSPWGHLVAGAIAGGVSRTATAPLETLRILAMTGNLNSSSGAAPAIPAAPSKASLPRPPRARGGSGATQLVSAAMDIVRNQGWQALYRGNVANVCRSAPQKALDFFAFDTLKEVISAQRGAGGRFAHSGAAVPSAASRAKGESKPQQLGAAGTLVAAGLAGALSSTVLYPLEVVRTRLSTDTAGVYKGVAHAMTTILQKEGPAALYRGIGPSVGAILPEAAITYGLFDLLKRGFASAAGTKDPGVLPSLTAGVVAAFTGQVVAYPLETVSRRMQVASVPMGAPEALRAIVAEGGLGALFRGLGAASVRVIPMALVSFGTYEWVRSEYTRLEEAISLRAATEQLRAPATQILVCSV